MTEGSNNSTIAKRTPCRVFLKIKETIKETILYIVKFKRYFKKNYPGKFNSNFNRKPLFKGGLVNRNYKNYRNCLGGC